MSSLSSDEEPWEEFEERGYETRDGGSLRREVELGDGDLALNFGPSLQPVNFWKKLSSCEEFVGAKRSKHTIVAWNEKMYVFGGDNGRRMLNDFLVSHIRDCSWARVVYTGEPQANTTSPKATQHLHLCTLSLSPRSAPGAQVPPLRRRFQGQYVRVRRLHGRHLLQLEPAEQERPL